MTKMVLIVCGGGASSGFLAANVRKAVKKHKADINVKARSESEISDYLDQIDLLLVGPHLSYMEKEIKQTAQEKGVPEELIDEEAYGMLDGETVYQQIEKILGGK